MIVFLVDVMRYPKCAIDKARDLVRFLALLLVAFVPLSGSAENVLLVIADDLGSDSLSGFNSNATASFPPTPMIDSLQVQGISFPRFYTHSTCSPSRAAIMTGRYAFRTGVYLPETNTLQPNDFTLPEALAASGVIGDRMACIGKWHLGEDADSPNEIGGWPHFAGSLGGGLPNYYNWRKTVDGVTSTVTNYATSENVDDALAWIGDQGDESWFLWLAFNAPHTPLQRPPNDLHDYDSITDDGANDSRDHFEAMVQAMDTELARLLASIDLTETTVIFMGDNGTLGSQIQPPFSSTHAKGSIYEGGIRVPLVIAGAAVDPGLKGTTYDGTLHAVDLYATILELFGVSLRDVVPTELVFDSRSFASLLSSGAYTRDPAELMCLNASDTNPEAFRAMVGQQFKYIVDENGTEEFYKVDISPREQINMLDGLLTDSQLEAYEELKTMLADYVNIPVVHDIYLDEVNQFYLKIGWFANATLTLNRSPNLTQWTVDEDAAILDDGSSTITLKASAPVVGSAFFTVTSE